VDNSLVVHAQVFVDLRMDHATKTGATDRMEFVKVEIFRDVNVLPKLTLQSWAWTWISFARPSSSRDMQIIQSFMVASTRAPCSLRRQFPSRIWRYRFVWY